MPRVLRPIRRCAGRRNRPPALAVDDVIVVADDLFVHGEDKHHGVLGNGHRIGAAVIGHRHARLPGGIHVETVVTGADELHELQIRRHVVERLPHVLARKPMK